MKRFCPIRESAKEFLYRFYFLFGFSLFRERFQIYVYMTLPYTRFDLYTVIGPNHEIWK